MPFPPSATLLLHIISYKTIEIKHLDVTVLLEYFNFDNSRYISKVVLVETTETHLDLPLEQHGA